MDTKGSLYEQFEMRGALIGDLEKALQAAGESADLAKTKLQTTEESMKALNVKIAALEKDAAEKAGAFAAEKKAVEDERDGLRVKLLETEAKLKLAPYADVTAGRAPVPDGGTAADGAAPLTGVELIGKLNNLHGYERMKFYKENKVAIDAAFNDR